MAASDRKDLNPENYDESKDPILNSFKQFYSVPIDKVINDFLDSKEVNQDKFFILATRLNYLSKKERPIVESALEKLWNEEGKPSSSLSLAQKIFLGMGLELELGIPKNHDKAISLYSEVANSNGLGFYLRGCAIAAYPDTDGIKFAFMRSFHRAKMLRDKGKPFTERLKLANPDFIKAHQNNIKYAAFLLAAIPDLERSYSNVGIMSELTIKYLDEAKKAYDPRAFTYGFSKPSNKELEEAVRQGYFWALFSLERKLSCEENRLKKRSFLMTMLRKDSLDLSIYLDSAVHDLAITFTYDAVYDEDLQFYKLQFYKLCREFLENKESISQKVFGLFETKLYFDFYEGYSYNPEIQKTIQHEIIYVATISLPRETLSKLAVLKQQFIDFATNNPGELALLIVKNNDVDIWEKCVGDLFNEKIKNDIKEKITSAIKAISSEVKKEYFEESYSPLADLVTSYVAQDPTLFSKNKSNSPDDENPDDKDKPSKKMGGGH